METKNDEGTRMTGNFTAMTAAAITTTSDEKNPACSMDTVGKPTSGIFEIDDGDVGNTTNGPSSRFITAACSAAKTTSTTETGKKKSLTTTSNVTPTKPIDGLEKVKSQAIRDAVIRAVTGILNTEPRNIGMCAKVRAQNRSAILTVCGMMRLTVKALDPSYWSMDETEMACVMDVKFDTVSRAVTVLLHENTAAIQTPEQTPPPVVAGRTSDDAFIAVAATGCANQTMLCVASLVAANVLAVARRREGLPSATVVAKMRSGAEYHDIETRGLTHIDARALVSTSWAGDDWPRLTTTTGNPTSLPMYVDVATGTHHTCIEGGGVVGSLIAVAKERCKAYPESEFPSNIRYGFLKTYRITEDDGRKRLEITNETPNTKRQCIRNNTNTVS